VRSAKRCRSGPWAAAAWLACGLLGGAACGPRAGDADTLAAGGDAITSPILSTAASNDDATVTYSMTYTGSHTFFRVYIDADQSATTGLAVGGIWAEYLIETGILYRYTGDGTSWSWSRIKAVSFTNTGSAVTYQVARSDLGEVAPCTEQADLVFDIDDAQSPKVTQVYTPSASCASGGAAAGSSSGASSISAPAASNDASNVSYQFSYAGAPSFFRVYIDTDLDPTTGFAATSGVGAEFLLEGGFLYSHSGAGWSWSSLGAATFSSAGQAARWTIARSRIGETAACGERSTLAFQTQDSGGALHTSAAFPQTFTSSSSCGGSAPPPPPPPPPPSGAPIQYVFVIAMENEAATAIYGNASAPYINGQLIPRYARAGDFADPLPDALPSEPHYVWMEAGTNRFGDVTFTGDADPSAANSTASTAHVATQLGAAGISWLSYQEGMAAGTCPVVSSGLYAAKHDPFVFFRDIAGSPPSTGNAFCAAHHRPYASFAGDLQAGAVARYNFITPNLCHDMHGDPACGGIDVIRAGDDWLAANLPPIINFINAHAGVIFIVWDEPEGGSTLLPFLAVGPHVKAGYASPVFLTHSSLTRSLDEIFGLPILGTVAGVNDFGDLFTAGTFP
jgi:hypothetical protein